jgi:hypothetical protein
MELQRPNMPYCHQCGYLEQGAAGEQCPECGATIPEVSDLELACLWAKTARWGTQDGKPKVLMITDAERQWQADLEAAMAANCLEDVPF